MPGVIDTIVMDSRHFGPHLSPRRSAAEGCRLSCVGHGALGTRVSRMASSGSRLARHCSRTMSRPALQAGHSSGSNLKMRRSASTRDSPGGARRRGGSAPRTSRQRANTDTDVASGQDVLEEQPAKVWSFELGGLDAVVVPAIAIVEVNGLAIVVDEAVRVVSHSLIPGVEQGEDSGEEATRGRRLEN